MIARQSSRAAFGFDVPGQVGRVSLSVLTLQFGESPVGLVMPFVHGFGASTEKENEAMSDYNLNFHKALQETVQKHQEIMQKQEGTRQKAMEEWRRRNEELFDKYTTDLARQFIQG